MKYYRKRLRLITMEKQAMIKVEKRKRKNKINQNSIHKLTKNQKI
jgi:hypothetical protein